MRVFKFVSIFFGLFFLFISTGLFAENLELSINSNGLALSGEKADGMNPGGRYHDDGGQEWYIKSQVSPKPQQNSLVTSYLASELINWIQPGSAPQIKAYLNPKTKELEIASRLMDDFNPLGYRESMHSSASQITLHLILDLLDIEDRHSHNVGFRKSEEGAQQAAAIDLDTGLDYRKSWICEVARDIFYENNENVVKRTLSLSTIESIPDELLAEKLSYWLNDLEPLANVLAPYNPMPFSALIDADYIISQALERKHQMGMLLEHFDLINKINQSNDLAEIKALTENIDLSNDPFWGVLLFIAIQKQNPRLVKYFLSKNIKDPRGELLRFASSSSNAEIVSDVLEHLGKITDVTGALQEAFKTGYSVLVHRLLKTCPFGAFFLRLEK